MSDKIRWRYGDTNPVAAAVDSATVIEAGDLVWQDVDDAKPASMIQKPELDNASMRPNTAYVEAMQRHFAAKFLGVARQRSHSGYGGPIRVATIGVFEFDVLVGECFELGNLIGVSITNLTQIIGENPGSNRDVLCNQRVVKVADPKLAIGRVAQFEHEPSSTVLVDIRSRVMGR